MKLVLCHRCSSLTQAHAQDIGVEMSCRCGITKWKLLDKLNLELLSSGLDSTVLGIANHALTRAVKDQMAYGDSLETMLYAGRQVPKGREVACFVIPEAADSVKRKEAV